MEWGREVSVRIPQLSSSLQCIEGNRAVRRWLLTFLGVLALLIVLVLGAGYLWLGQPMHPQGPALDLTIEPGTKPRGVAQAVIHSGATTSADLLFVWFRLSGQARQIKAGSYEITNTTTPRSLLLMLTRGEETLRAFTLVEGWNFRQVRQALAKADELKQDSKEWSDAELMSQLGRPGLHPEGRFYPDTYTYAKGASDMAVLKRALQSMDSHLAQAWANKSALTPLKSSEEALILASLVEKETGKAADRPLIAGVFANRLRIGMLLQTDPTVIYGLGADFDGNLRRSDLRGDTPYNTYTRAGLPPTPIAMPGKAALAAAVQPASTPALYFVAKGDGSSHFSSSLSEHNRAVNRYQRGQGGQSDSDRGQ
jgi:UPF0755 protein